MHVKWTLVALLACCATPGLAQDKQKLQAEIDALREENNRLKDDLITKDRRLDQFRRKASEQLEQAQRKLEDEVRLARLERARQGSKLGTVEFELARARALLKKHGIELPKPPSLAERIEGLEVSVYFELGYALGDAIAYLRTVSGVNFVLEDGLAEVAVQPLRLSKVSLKNVLGLVLESLEEPLGWRIDGDTVVIGPKPPPK